MNPRRLFLLAGEPSGDMLGGRLMRALRADAPALEMVGVGGARMIDEGLEPLFPMDELSLMGFAEVVPHLPRLLRRMRETVAAVERLRPAVVLTIDSPGFSLRLQRRLAGRGVTRVHYVAPQVWAWHASRARHLARDLDRLLVLLPFEASFFERHGLASTFVGHPIVEEVESGGDGGRFRAAHGLRPETPLLCLLPGSRQGEIRRHLPVLVETVRLLRRNRPGLGIVLPTLAVREREIRSLTTEIDPPPLIVTGRSDRLDAYAACRAAVAASGTVSLEVALAGLPFVTIYKTGPLTAWLARRLITVPYVNLANLIVDRGVVPEFLQQDCTPDRIVGAVTPLLDDEAAARQAQRDALAEVAARLGADDPTPPSARAAAAVLDLLASSTRERPS